MSLTAILVLYLAFRAKQLVCDYFLQTAWIATVKGVPKKRDAHKALVIHASIHAAGTFLLALIFAPALWWLGLVDFFVHGTIDKIKSVITTKNNWGYNDTFYWWSLGIDQEAHNLTHLAYIVAIVLHSGGL